MPLPLRSLPVIQNWDCHGCGDCCKTYHVRVTDAEKIRIEAMIWEGDPAMTGVKPIVWDSVVGHRLNHTETGECVFLGPDNKCRIHAKYGSATKPMTCRIYPFTFAPAGDHWRVGIRYACPSAVDNKGRSVEIQGKELQEYAGFLEASAGPNLPTIDPVLNEGQTVPWNEALRFVDALNSILEQDKLSLQFRLRVALNLANTCRKSKFDKIAGQRLDEFLEVMILATAEETPIDNYSVTPPSWVGRVIFRQIAAIYARKDNGPEAGVAKTSRLTRFRSAWRFALGSGPIPRLHARIPDITFAQAEVHRNSDTTNTDSLLTRYFMVKLNSLQFFGRPNFDRTFWDGFDSLLLVYPIVQWLARVFAADAVIPYDDAVRHALRIVDDNFGYNPILGRYYQTWAIRTLSDRGEIARLIAWYSR